MKTAGNYPLRMLRSAVGGGIFGFGTVIVMRCGLGYGSWDVLHAGLSYHTGILMGDISIIVSFILIALDFLLKESVGIGTFLSMIVCGKAIDLFMMLLPKFRFPVYGLAYLPMAGGMFICAYGAYFYMSAGLGTGARDGIMVAIRRRLRLPIGAARFLLEVIAATIGWFLGGPVGPATFIMAATLGFAVQAVFRLFRFETNKAPQEDIFETFRKLRRYFASK